MSAKKWSVAFILAAAMVVPGTAQQSGSANIALEIPVPAWPANGVIPAELKNHSVFVDLPKNEFVLAYPENLGSPNFEKDGPAQRRVTRYPMQRNVEPRVAVTVAQTAGKFRYDYSVTNAPSAKQPIDQFAIVLPEGAATAKAAPAWWGIVQNNRKLAVAPDWIKSVNAAVFSYEKPDGQIQPGSKKAGFSLESDLKPGFTVGYFRQQESLEASVQNSGNIPSIVVRNATPPPPAGGAPAPGGGGGFGGNQAPAGATTAWEPIKADIDKLQRFEFNSKTVLLIGPKYDRNATEKTIASDFIQGITLLSKSGVLTADSPFVKAVLSDLDAYVKAGGSGPLKLSAQPRGDAETEIFNAMKASLRIS